MPAYELTEGQVEHALRLFNFLDAMEAAIAQTWDAVRDDDDGQDDWLPNAPCRRIAWIIVVKLVGGGERLDPHVYSPGKGRPLPIGGWVGLPGREHLPEGGVAKKQPS